MNKDFFAVAPSGVIYLAHVAIKGENAGSIYAVTRGYNGFHGHEDAKQVVQQDNDLILRVLRNAFEMNRHRITRMFDPAVAVTVNVL